VKVLLVNDYAEPFGGAEALTFGLRDGLRRRGHDARVFASSAGVDGALEADYRCTGTTSSVRTLLQSANPFAARELRRVLRAFQPDVVHVRMFLTQLSPLILPLLRDVPSIYHVVWYRPICPIGTKLLPDGSICRVPPGAVCYRAGCLPLRDWGPLMMQMRLWRRWRDVFDVVVANSDAVRGRLLAEGIEPVEVIPNGVPVRPGRGPLADPPTVVYAGRLVPEKGVDVLVRAFAGALEEVPEARLTIAGDGPAAGALRGLVRTLGMGDCVEMTGRLPRRELERRFEGAWVQAVPSRWEEPFGIVAAEAMMRGTAVVASATGGLLEIVEESCGLLVPPVDVAALTSALVRVLSVRELAESFGAAGRRIALERFGLPRFVEAILSLYRELLAGRYPQSDGPPSPAGAPAVFQ
jgi:glycosyltransferase involved in cell wall biosynthesis